MTQNQALFEQIHLFEGGSTLPLCGLQPRSLADLSYPSNSYSARTKQLEVPIFPVDTKDIHQPSLVSSKFHLGEILCTQQGSFEPNALFFFPSF